ncbi:hypothetical protein L1I79_17255 [Strepomyces sp. STD 3.1]|uniref:hypothetical protein n=1 Tax=Streptomyces sp. NPDC058985 TaxID=3346684 RepID=UPI001F1B63B2|nr:hypothetical protein [Streptomyces sp. STD 3.1]
MSWRRRLATAGLDEHSNQFGDWQDAVLIVPPCLVARFTQDVTAAIQPAFGHVVGRHGLELGGVTAAPALPDMVTTGVRYCRSDSLALTARNGPRFSVWAGPALVVEAALVPA